MRSEGVKEQSKKHGYLLSLLGVRQFAVVVNKMDLVGYRQDVFDGIEKEYREFLGQFRRSSGTDHSGQCEAWR